MHITHAESKISLACKTTQHKIKELILLFNYRSLGIWYFFFIYPNYLEVEITYLWSVLSRTMIQDRSSTL